MRPGNLVRYPIHPRKLTATEKLALRIKFLPMFCTVCGSLSLIYLTNDNFRENCYCVRCRSFNRQRQIAYVLCTLLANKKIKSLRDLHLADNIAIYNTESGGTLHRFLSRAGRYVSSEYFGDQYTSGQYIDGRMHQDLMCLSFSDNQFDFVFSTDVFEHVADPYVGHQEVYRVLKPGGRHIFTVPFYQSQILDENRASILNGELVHHKEPLYHIDPLRPEGVLVFNIFAIEMIVKLAKIGFRTNMHHLYRPSNGILGTNGLVFEAVKEPPQP
jgi:SAM-dependent methyltransferase